MKQRYRLVEVLHRAETGPVIDEADFERHLVAPTIKRLVEEYDIKFDESAIVPSDNELADRVFQAGLDFAAEVGLLCQSTSRRITWTRGELEEGLRTCASEVTMGLGVDAVVARARVPEDSTYVVIAGGPYGIPFPEEMFVPVSLSYLKLGAIDVIDNASLETVYGHPVKAGTAWEVVGAWREVDLAMQAIKTAGRPGMPLAAVELSPTALGGIAGVSWGGYRPSDRHHVATVSEFKTNYDLLSIVSHITRIGGVLECYYNPIYGGYVGGAEGVAVAIAAGMILLNQVDMGHLYSTRPNHPFYGCDTTPELLWATSLGIQSLTRNTDLMISSLAGPAGGPGTKTMLYENAAFSMMAITSGVSELASSHSAGGGVPRHGSGLDSKICAEVAHAVRGMSREQANELVSQLVAIYEPDIKTKPIGKPFEEVYDVDNIEPTPEWQGMYDEVRDELIKMGLPLDRLAY